MHWARSAIWPVTIAPVHRHFQTVLLFRVRPDCIWHRAASAGRPGKNVLDTGPAHPASTRGRDGNAGNSNRTAERVSAERPDHPGKVPVVDPVADVPAA